MSDSWTVVGHWGPYPAPGGALRGHLLRQTGAGELLVGCGSGVAARLDYHVGAWADLAAVLLPDLHPAHTADIQAVGSRCLRLARERVRRGLLPVYAPLADPGFSGLSRPGVLDPRGVGPGDAMRAGAWDVHWGPAGHGALALRLSGAAGTAAFVPQAAWTPDLASFLAGVGLMVVECGDPDGEANPEEAGATARRAGELARAAGAQVLLLTHLDPATNPELLAAEARAAHPQAQVALEGRTYDIPTGSASSPV